MVFTAVISILVGAALGLRFNVLIVVPAIILVLGGTAAVGIAHADHMGSAVLIAASICTALQVGYLIGGFARVAVNSVGASTRSTAAADYRSPGAQIGPSALNILNIRERMEVVGSDGDHVGVVDHTESAERIVLTGDDPSAGGKPHLISVDWVEYVDSKVHLNKPSKKAVLEWQVAA
jgi:hypothetical protein